jgi:DNA-binding NtrC family response regulator
MSEIETTNKQAEAGVKDEQPVEAPKLTSSRRSAPNVGLRRFRAEAEIRAIREALEQVGWNRKRAAELLSISYRGLLYKICQHNITAASSSPLNPFPEGPKAE